MEKELLEMIKNDLVEIKGDVKEILKKDPVGRAECEVCRQSCRSSLKQQLQGEIKAAKGLPPWLCVVMAVMAATLSWIFGVYPIVQKAAGG